VGFIFSHCKVTLRVIGRFLQRQISYTSLLIYNEVHINERFILQKETRTNQSQTKEHFATFIRNEQNRLPGTETW
jgi:hypothetical protein